MGKSKEKKQQKSAAAAEDEPVSEVTKGPKQHKDSTGFLLGGQANVDSDLNDIFQKSKKPIEEPKLTQSAVQDSKKQEQKLKSKINKAITQEFYKNIENETDPSKIAAQKALAVAQSIKAGEPINLPSEDKIIANRSKNENNNNSSNKSSKKSEKGSKPSTTKEEEEEEEEDRTIFVGNCPLECIKSKSSHNALLRHLINCLPENMRNQVSIESLRYRSIPLATPIASKAYRDSSKKKHELEYEQDDDADEENHSRKRARTWKENEVADDTDRDSSLKQSKVFLTPQQKRKLAFIKSDFHENADSCTAYFVFTLKKSTSSASASASTSSSTKTTSNTTTVDQIRKTWVQYADGTFFMEKTLRADLATSRLAEIQQKKADVNTAKEIAQLRKQQAEDDKRSVYVGGLDFGESEEKLRDLIEKLIIEKRGDAPKMQLPSDFDVKLVTKKPSWVRRVRVVRDKETGIGKGFAYVLLENAECVDELLAVPESQVKLSKRKLRLQRCKSVGKHFVTSKQDVNNNNNNNNSSKSSSSKPTMDRNENSNKRANVSTSSGAITSRTPEEIEAWAKKLASMTKEERKAVKASDPIRLARRAGKRQTKAEQRRKDMQVQKAKKAAPSKHKHQKQKKTRQRSDRAIMNKNRKKD